MLLGAKSDAAARIVNYLNSSGGSGRHGVVEDDSGDDAGGNGGAGAGAPEVGRAAEEAAAAAETLEALARQDYLSGAGVGLARNNKEYNVGAVGSLAQNTGGSDDCRGSAGSTGGGEDPSIAIGGSAGQDRLPVSAADLVALHARAAIAVAADYDAAAMDVRDALIADQRKAIQCLVAALESKANVSEKDCGLPESCSVGRLDARWQALNRDPAPARFGRKEDGDGADGDGGSNGSQCAAVMPLVAIRIEAEALAARAFAAAGEAQEREDAAIVDQNQEQGPSTPEQAKHRLSSGSEAGGAVALELELDVPDDASESWLGRLTPPPLTPVREQRTGELGAALALEDPQPEHSNINPGTGSGGVGGGANGRSTSARGGSAKSSKSSATAAKLPLPGTGGRGAGVGSVKPSPYAAASAASRMKGSSVARRLGRVASKGKKTDGDVSDNASEASEV